MGKWLYNQLNTSPEKTRQLNIPELVALADLDETSKYHVVHKRYFEKEKAVCPTCGKTETRSSKMRTRTLKDNLSTDPAEPRIVDLVYDQRYYRCNCCGNRVFPESITFAESGCRYTNRLSDMLAEGTLTHSYSSVCKHYGVPASKTSVGVIMRRIYRQKLGKLPPLKTPITFSVFIVNSYPVVLNVTDDNVYFVDLLEESSDDAYRAFFSQFDAKAVERIYVDADEQLVNAVSSTFPQAQIMMSDESILRCIREAFNEIIMSEGKRSGIPHRKATLTKIKKYLTEEEEKRIRHALSNRPRLRAAYIAYQELLTRMDSPWSISIITDWLSSLDEYLSDEASGLAPLEEFDIVSDVLELYSPLLEAYLEAEKKTPALYKSAITGIADAVENMPSCIYDVLRARMTLNSSPKIVIENEQEYRIGIPVDVLTQTMNDITDKIKEEHDNYGYESEDSTGWD